MSGIVAAPQEVTVTRDAQHVCLHIHGGGTLKFPPGVAHWMARQLVHFANEVEKETGRAWPNLSTKRG